MSELNEWDQIDAEPFRSHQCLYYNNEGRRCRAYAVRNEYVCVRHRVPGETINIVKSSPFDLLPALAGLRNPAQIQAALAQVASRLASRTIDDKRAGLILYALQSAVLNLANSPAARLPRILDAVSLRRRKRRAFRWQPQPLQPPQDAVMLSDTRSAESKADIGDADYTAIDRVVLNADEITPSESPSTACNPIKPDPLHPHSDNETAHASYVSEVTKP